MSLEKEDLRLKMLPDMMERLRLIADVRGKDYAHQAIILLEKAIMGDYHEVSLMLERANKNRKKRESLGLVGKVGVNPESQILEIKTTVSGGAEPVDGIFQGPINGWNVDSTMHYGRFSKSDIFTATNNYDVLYLVSRIRCRSTSAVSGNSVKVNLGQGCMYYMKF